MQAQKIKAIEDLDRMAGKYLTFVLGGESYGLEILKVQEIIGLMNITAVPRTPSHTRGVINLRGKIIPVIDLRMKFGMEKIEDTERTCIIVVDVEMEEQIIQTGLLVDAVSEVLAIDGESIEPAPTFGGGVNSGFIRGMAKCEGEVKILLCVENILDDKNELGDLAELAKQSEAKAA